MKKSLIISSYDDLHNPFYAGGGARAIHEVARRLTRYYHVTVLTGKYRGSQNRIIDGVAYQRIGLISRLPQLSQLFYLLSLHYYAYKLKYDYWVESFTPPFSVSLLPLIVKKPLIGLVHMLAGRDMQRKYHLPFTKVENAGLKLYRSFIVLSQETADMIKKVNKEAKVSIIPNGVDKDLFNYKHRVNKVPYILYLGRFEINQKGLDLLLSSYSLLSNKHIRLMIVGGGTDQETSALKVMVNNHKLSDRISLLSRVEGEAKVNLLKEASIVVIPSRFETFSLTALESLAVGTPVICFPIRGMQWIKGYAYFADKLNALELARALTRLLEDRLLLARLSRAGRRFARRYDWAQIAKQYHQVISSKL